MRKIIELSGKVILETNKLDVSKLEKEIKELKVLYEQNQSPGDGRGRLRALLPLERGQGGGGRRPRGEAGLRRPDHR